MWKALKSLGLPNKTSSCEVSALKVNKTVQHDTNLVLGGFKDYYSNLAGNLLKKLPKPLNKFTLNSVFQHYKGIIQSGSFNLATVSENTILTILKNTKVSKAAGLDNLSGRFLRDGAKVLAKPTTDICNLSISKFPDSCKLAKLKPIYKKGSLTEASNYRPISLLPLISKVITKVIHDETSASLNSRNLLYNYQSGFRKKHSTDFCLSFLNDKILKGFDQGLITGMILIDLQKAFDTIDHDILPQKFYAIGFSKHSVNWFRSYLTNRTLLVNLGNVFSQPACVSNVVPQGSILGPLLFLIYINDMSQAVKCNLFLYVDDTCLVCQHKDINEIEKQLNKDFESICDWFVDNKLSIHFGDDKTKSILFASKFKIKKVRKLNIKHGNIQIKQHSKVKYLGCMLDETMSREAMALSVINKINNKLKFLHRNNRFLTPTLRRLLCNALIQPHFDYACPAWYPNLIKKLKNRIQTSQNKCIRFCLQLDKTTHISHKEFETLNWLPVTERFNQCINSIVFKYVNDQCPNYLNEVFQTAPENNIQTRGSFLRLKCPIRKTNAGQMALSYIGPTMRSKTPDTLKRTKNLNTFKHNLKEHHLKKLKNSNSH